jgi:hypothetical protein
VSAPGVSTAPRAPAPPPRVPAPLADEERRSVEAEIERTAERFELRPLLALLAELGYSEEQILLQSTQESRSASLVRAVRFRRDGPIRSVLITVHIGLLGDSTLLPSYFFHIASRLSEEDRGRFYDFLRFFDHRLIGNLYAALYPELSGVYHEWPTVTSSFLRMTQPASPATLQWIVQLCFPEFMVRVTRRPFEEERPAWGCRTGKSVLDGTAILGPVFQFDDEGFLVDLIAEDEVDMRGREHAGTVLRRLHDRLLPWLAPFRIRLRIRLTVLWHESWAHVNDPPPRHPGYLGYERIKDSRPARHMTRMFDGITGVDTVHVHALED